MLLYRILWFFGMALWLWLWFTFRVFIPMLRAPGDRKRALRRIIDMEIECYGQPMSYDILLELGRDIEAKMLLEGRWIPDPGMNSPNKPRRVELREPPPPPKGPAAVHPLRPSPTESVRK